ncbi:MAG: class I SAM-dependent methyltransferase [Spirochaetes bacterium]|nr:class I SAM-dependent methyltransferase [Spirochaetota bacterium]
MPEIFNPEHLNRLESKERKKLFPACKILKWSGLKRKHKMIDFGAGTGFFSFPALKITGGRGSVLAYDIEPLMIKYLTSRAAVIRSAALKNNLLISDKLTDLYQSDENADFFWIGNVLHEVDDPLSVLKTAAGTLKEEGVIAILEWRKVPSERGPELEDRFSEDQLRRMLLESGFGRISFRKWNDTHFIIKAFKTGNSQFILPPAKMNFILKIILKAAEKHLGKNLRANRILAWYPKTLIGSGIMEALVAHDDDEVPKRLLNLLRLYVSYSVSCPFCIDLNAVNFRINGISEDELNALQGKIPISKIKTFSEAENAALEYAACLTATPVRLSDEVVMKMKLEFSERAITVIAGIISQVNFWARLIQGFGIYEAGFSPEPEVLGLSKYGRRKKN